mmetsp:Transcript_30268/g.66992  ORF Transcript_30268/g.66992 Transcript_30268/m.66992 type:complete len:275 (+) Transcript_30268:860-1684(+)
MLQNAELGAYILLVHRLPGVSRLLLAQLHPQHEDDFFAHDFFQRRHRRLPHLHQGAPLLAHDDALLAGRVDPDIHLHLDPPPRARDGHDRGALEVADVGDLVVRVVQQLLQHHLLHALLQTGPADALLRGQDPRLHVGDSDQIVLDIDQPVVLQGRDHEGGGVQLREVLLAPAEFYAVHEADHRPRNVQQFALRLHHVHLVEHEDDLLLGVLLGYLDHFGEGVVELGALAAGSVDHQQHHVCLPRARRRSVAERLCIGLESVRPSHITRSVVES